MMKLYLCSDFDAPIQSHQRQHELAMHMLDSLLDDPEWSYLRPYMLTTDTYGKPFLKDHPEICFNISHCPVCIAVVISDTPVGIDVQQHFEWKDSLAERISTAQEYAWLMAAPNEEERTDRLNLLWCRKESFLKCIGMGLREDLRRVAVMPKQKTLHCAAGSFQFIDFNNRSYTMCICTRIID